MSYYSTSTQKTNKQQQQKLSWTAPSTNCSCCGSGALSVVCKPTLASLDRCSRSVGNVSAARSVTSMSTSFFSVCLRALAGSRARLALYSTHHTTSGTSGSVRGAAADVSGPRAHSSSRTFPTDRSTCQTRSHRCTWCPYSVLRVGLAPGSARTCDLNIVPREKNGKEDTGNVSDTHEMKDSVEGMRSLRVWGRRGLPGAAR